MHAKNELSDLERTKQKTYADGEKLFKKLKLEEYGSSECGSSPLKACERAGSSAEL